MNSIREPSTVETLIRQLPEPSITFSSSAALLDHQTFIQKAYLTTELTITASPSPLVKERSGLSQVLYARVCGQLRVECFFNGPIEKFLPKQLVKVHIIDLLIIVETVLAGNSFTALSCSDFKGQGPWATQRPAIRSDILSAQPIWTVWLLGGDNKLGSSTFVAPFSLTPSSWPVQRGWRLLSQPLASERHT